MTQAQILGTMRRIKACFPVKTGKMHQVGEKQRRQRIWFRICLSVSCIYMECDLLFSTRGKDSREMTDYKERGGRGLGGKHKNSSPTYWPASLEAACNRVRELNGLNSEGVSLLFSGHYKRHWNREGNEK